MSGRWIAIAAIWLAVGGMVSTLALTHVDASALIAIALLGFLTAALSTGLCVVVQEKHTYRTRREVPASVLQQTRRGD